MGSAFRQNEGFQKPKKEEAFKKIMEMRAIYEDMPECPARKGGDEWYTSNAPPLVGGARGGGKFGIFTPTLILPHQGGGDIF